MHNTALGITLLFDSFIVRICPADKGHCKPTANLRALNIDSVLLLIGKELKVIYFESGMTAIMHINIEFYKYQNHKN